MDMQETLLGTFPLSRKCRGCGADLTGSNYRNVFCGRPCANKTNSTRWSELDVQRLRALYGAYKPTDPIPIGEFAAILKKTPAAVKGKAHALGISSNQRPRSDGMPRYKYVRAGFREDLGMAFRSSWEANYARALNSLQEEGDIEGWKYESRRFLFPGVSLGPYSYLPDFEVQLADKREWHEVKGYERSSDRSKWRRFREFYPGETLVVVREFEYRQVEAAVSMFIEHWEW